MGSAIIISPIAAGIVHKKEIFKAFRADLFLSLILPLEECSAISQAAAAAAGEEDKERGNWASLDALYTAVKAPACSKEEKNMVIVKIK